MSWWPTTDATTAYVNTGTIWNAWVTSANATATTNATTTGTTGVWGQWITATVTAAGVWGAWVRNAPAVHTPRRAMTDAETIAYRQRLQAERERTESYRRLADEERAKRIAAEKRAEDLLLHHLAPEQRDEYQRMKAFTVHLPNGHVYKICKGRHGNVQRLERGQDGTLRRLENLCVHVRPDCPDQDNMLAQKLILESDENTLRNVANISRYR